MSLSMTVQQDYSDNIMNTYGRYPLTISYGKGSRLFDVDGKEYLDFASGIATCCLGHAHPALRKAINDQMDRVTHVSNLYFIPEQAKLAKWLVKNSCADKVFFCNSGAEANEAAIKLSRKYAHTKMKIDFPIILTALESFHG
jgi:acetylornithine aminotransferase